MGNAQEAYSFEPVKVTSSHLPHFSHKPAILPCVEPFSDKIAVQKHVADTKQRQPID